MIDSDAVRRAKRLVEDAIESGGRILAGGTYAGQYFAPTVLVDVGPNAALCVEEAFAPIIVASRFHDLDDAVDRANGTEYGLQAGFFTTDLRNAWYAFRNLEVGGVILNDVPGYRLDHMPYGGVKASGLGREGVRWAIEEMTDLRLGIFEN